MLVERLGPVSIEYDVVKLMSYQLLHHCTVYCRNQSFLADSWNYVPWISDQGWYGIISSMGGDHYHTSGLAGGVTQGLSAFLIEF